MLHSDVVVHGGPLRSGLRPAFESKWSERAFSRIE